MSEFEKVEKSIVETLGVDAPEASKIIEKALIGGEITDEMPAEKWLEERFLPNSVVIDEEGYSRMCIDALKILGTTAATDYGGSRQRDLGQLWADMTRGYLGELAFSLFLKNKWGIEAELGHEVGSLEDFLPTDIHLVSKKGEIPRPPKINIGIKTIKWNGIWLDIPGDQFSHSDVHVVVKVGTGRDHLFAFFKKISVFKDKVLKTGENVGALTPSESQKLFDNLPTFKPIAAYICGQVPRDNKYESISYSGKKGRKNYKIFAWNGPIEPGDLAHIKNAERILGSVTFEGIGEFAHDKGYLFNTGNLLWQAKDWQKIVDRL